LLLKVIQQLIKSENLNDEKGFLFAKSTYRFVLKLAPAKELKQVSSELKITSALMEFKRVHLNNSHYVLSRLWRAVYSFYCKQESCERCARCSTCLGELVCENFEWDLLALAEEYMVDVIDLEYIINHNIIQPADKQTLYARKDMLNPPNPQIINEVIMEALPHIKYTVYKKLAFIFKYNNLDPMDFVYDLMAWALSHLNDNDYLTDRDELVKIVKTCVNQMTVNIIAQYTAKKRSRLTSTEGGYASTTISLDANEYMPQKVNDFKKVNSFGLSEHQLLQRISVGMNPDEIYFLRARLEGRPKGDILNELKWSNKRSVAFKDKVKNLLDMCVI
jgi:hypothetical protein